MALKLDILANTRDFVRNMVKAGASVEDVSDELDDMAREGSTAGEKVERSFREIATTADKTGDKIKTSMRSSISDGFSEAKKEAGQSGREAAASFGGGFEDVADAAQETLANAFAGFGPIGAAAGVAIAAALGAALQGAADAQERLAEARQAAGELAQTLYENKGELPMADAVSKLLDLLPSERGAGNPFESFLNQWLDLGTNIDAVKAAARQAQTPMETFTKGLSGANLSDTITALDAVQDAIDKVKEKAKGELNIENGAALAQLESLKSSLLQTKSSIETADALLKTVGKDMDTAAQVEKIEAIGEAWQNAMVDAQDYIAEQDGVATFDWSKYLADAEMVLEKANEYKRRIVTLPADIQDEAEKVFEDLGAVSANLYIDAYESATPEVRQRFVAVAKGNGEAAGKASGQALADSAERAAQATAQGWSPLDMEVRANVNDTAVRTWRAPIGYMTVEQRIKRVGAGWEAVKWE